MIDHITLGVTEFSRSTDFYMRALAPLGIKRLFDVPEEHSGGVEATGFGDDRPWFWLAGERPTTGLVHVAFSAESREAVDRFHAAAILAGGIDNGPPGLRPQYHASYYAAFVFDPDGHNIEAVCHTPSP